MAFRFAPLYRLSGKHLRQQLAQVQRSWRRSRLVWCLILTALLVPAACGEDGDAAGEGDGGIVLSGVWSRPVLIAETAGTQHNHSHATAMPDHSTHDTMGSGANGAVYATIENRSDEDERLVAVTSDIAEAVELHTVLMEGSVMQMRQVDAIDIPAGETVSLEPGGYHVMLIGLKRNLEVGDEFNVTFEFERIGTITIASTVSDEAP